MVFMEVAPTQTRSSPNKMSRPSGSFTPEKFSAINQANASRVHIKPLGNSQRLHQHQLSVESLWISCFDFFIFFREHSYISVGWGFVSNFHKDIGNCLFILYVHDIVFIENLFWDSLYIQSVCLSVFDARNQTSSLTSTFHLLKGSGGFFLQEGQVSIK